MSKTNKEKGPHQAKNKISDATKENDFEVVEQNSADERKTVIVDKDFENLEFDDKVWLWWRENKVSVIAAVIAAVAIIVIFNGYRMLEAKALKEAQSAYQECNNDLASLETFAKEYAYSELAGIAGLQVADAEYAKSNFAKAQELYTSALGSLNKNQSEITAKAQMGIAFCQIKQGNKADAVASLKAITQHESVNPAFKAEASFQLAVLEFSNGEKLIAKGLLDSLVQNPNAGIWASQAENFIKINY